MDREIIDSGKLAAVVGISGIVGLFLGSRGSGEYVYEIGQNLLFFLSFATFTLSVTFLIYTMKRKGVELKNE